ncbi:hypothetical protein ACFL0H_12150 [Thermodesulfobacteriota bacterium]
MFSKPTTQSLKSISAIHPPFSVENRMFSPGHFFLLFALPFIISVLLFTGCATIYRPTPKEPLSLDEVKTVISRIQEQEDKVASFYSSGTILVKDWKWESEADILIAGIRRPLRIKIEITHPWGRPILHFLIDNRRLQVLSFNEKKLYLGDFTPETLSRFFPGIFFDYNMIWAVLRGYPTLKSHIRIISPGANRISLLNQKGEDIEVIELYPENLLPKRVSFPGNYVDMAFSGYKENNGIYYAAEVTVKNIKGGRALLLNNRKKAFNGTIPDQIFILKKPPGFETVYLDEVPGDVN